jgi:hypothetical protein
MAKWIDMPQIQGQDGKQGQGTLFKLLDMMDKDQKMGKPGGGGLFGSLGNQQSGGILGFILSLFSR